MTTTFEEEHNGYLLKVLENTRQKLLDTTRRNRLLNFRESARDIAIIDEMADLVFEELTLNGNSFYFDFWEEEETKGDDLFDEQEPERALPETRRGDAVIDPRYIDNRLQTPLSEKELERRLRRLYLEHRSMIEETGANSLFLSIGFLEWTDNQQDSKPYRSPLMLVPVRLTREGSAGQALYTLAFDDNALDTNYSLVEKLKKDFDIKLPQIEEEEQPESYWERVNAAITRRRADGWKVIHEMALGLFRFNKQVMWHDLNPERWPKHAPLIDKKVIKRILVGAKEGEQEPGQITQEYVQDSSDTNEVAPSLKLIRDADSSQYSSLIDALNCDGGLVIEGPPGTGKSQTITNLIAIALNQGLSVLFVAEKMAALEVVHKRLSENGLDPFCLQLHGLKTNKKELLESIADRIDYKPERASELRQKEQQLKQARAELISYSKVMSERMGPEDLPLFDIAWKIERLRQELPEEIEGLDIDTPIEVEFGDFNAIRNKLNDLGSEWSAIPEDGRSAWIGYLPLHYDEKSSDRFSKLLAKSIERLVNLNTFLLENNVENSVPVLFEITRILELSKSTSEDLLKDLPFGIDQGIVKNVVTKNSLEEFRALIEAIQVYLEDVEFVNQTFDFSSEHATSYAKLLFGHSKRLTDVILNSSVPVNSLAAETKILQGVVTHLKSLDSNCKYASELLNSVSRTIEDFEDLLLVSEFLVDGPAELSLHATTYHSKSSIRNHLEQASGISENLVNRSSEMSQFVISRIDNSIAIHEAMLVIESNISNIFAVFRADYRKSKKFIKRVLANSKTFKKDTNFVDSLVKLHDLILETEEFEENEDFKTALGGLFKGVKTDWGKLDSLISYSQSLREKVGTENASAILADWDTHLDCTVELREKLESSLREISRFKESHPYPNSQWQRPVNEIASTLDPWIEKLKRASKDLNQSWCRSTTTMQEAQEVALRYQKTKIQERKIEALPAFRELLNSKWDRASTKIEILEKVESWISTTLSHAGMDINVLKWLFEQGNEPNKEKFESLHRNITNFADSWTSQLTLFNKFGKTEELSWVGGHGQSIKGFAHKLKSALDNISCLPLMNRWNHSSQSLEQIGFSALTQLVASGVLSDFQCGKAYEYYLYRTLFNKKVDSDSLLSNFSQSQYEGTRDRFAKLDREIMQTNANQIATKLAGASVPTGVGNGPVANFSQKRLLVHETNKLRRHIPIRQLVRRSADAIKALKPCFLMSPLSVAQYLGPGDIHFDLVVMDEASQMRPEDALGAIARADKSIIVGDPKQLPPSNFFDSSLPTDEEDEDGSVIDDTEAILDVCLKQFPFRRLRWHYRSQHESLIQFSNEQFYDGDLIVFPSPNPDSRDFGVHYNFINDPAYSRGRNRPEAEVVVENIVKHFYRHTEKSLGIATFNKAQAEEVRLLLDKTRLKDPVVDARITEQERNEPLFIKNLENVQGDERDVIFISTTYGPETPEGPVAQRFGPINSESGWRRLNVIATRAKQRVEVFTSMRPTDVGRGGTPKRGVRALRDYLEFAKNGEVTDKGVRTGKAPDSEFEIAVIKMINDLGYQCEPQVGVAGFFIDIGVIHPDRPGEYLIGIECDGATYHSSTSVRDRDRLRQEILESKGWSIHRIWSTNWFHSRSTEIDRLDRALKSRVDEDRLRHQAAELEDTPDIASETVVATEFELEKEIEEEGELLEEALERFWQQNIKPLYPDRSRSILSEDLIKTLVAKRPLNSTDWFESISVEQRQKVDPNEGEYRQDIFEIIAEYD